MSEFPLAADDSGRQPASDLRNRLLRLVMVHLGAMAVLGIAAVAILVMNPPDDVLRYSVFGGGAAGCLAIVAAAVYQAKATAHDVEQETDDSVRRAQRSADYSTQHVQQWIDSLRATVERGKEEFPQLLEQLRAGEHPAPRWPADEPATDDDPFAMLAHEIRQAQAAAEFAVVRMQQVSGASTIAGAISGSGDPDVAVFANIARRVQSLAHRAIQRLDELEQQVEDPELLKGLFAVDHMVTGVRRQAESLAVLGGSLPRRQWSQPVAMYTVLRSAVAEVEHYERVKVLPPVDGRLQGHAVADVIHLVAELVENATSYSEPDTQVTVSSQSVTAGLAIDIRDRGLGISSDERAKLNGLLANPSGADRDARLKEGRIGLYVVAQLAHRHRVAVELENNMYGGTDAHIVIPNAMLGDLDDEPDLGPAEAVPEAAAGSEQHTTVLPATPSLPPLPETPQVPAATPPATSSPVEPSQPADSVADRIGSGAHRIYANDRTPRHSAGRPAASQSAAAVSNAAEPGNATAPRRARASNGASASGSADATPRYGRHTGTVPDAAPDAARTTMSYKVSNEERPPLPRRDRTKSYVAPQLTDNPSVPSSEGARGTPNPGLWAAYRQGIEGGSQDQDGSGDRGF